MEIEYNILRDLISKSSYFINGASTEKDYSKYLAGKFSNSENYWRLFIVPATVRVEPNNLITDITEVRDGVSQELKDIGSYHYSIFINLVNAEKVLESNIFPYFEQFYFYLGIVCDLAEEFLQRVYFLIKHSLSQKIATIELLDKETFLRLAEDWYDKNYSTLHTQYFSKGKMNPIRIPNRKYILDEYFLDSEAWRNYKTTSQQIRAYRNIIAHHHKLAFLQDENGILYIPISQKLSQYKRWSEVQKITKEKQFIPNDFVPMRTQVHVDLESVKTSLHNLWDKPIQDLYDLLYVQRNSALLKLYNLSII